MPTKAFTWPEGHEDLHRILAALGVASKRRRGRRTRSKPTLTHSEWNGDAGVWPFAPVIFRVLTAMSIPCRANAGNKTAALVAEILDATAWALNRRDVRVLGKLAEIASNWNRKQAPLVAASRGDWGPRYVGSYGTGLHRQRALAEARLQAYEAAVQWLEQWLRQPTDPDLGSGVTAWDALAWEALMVIRPPLPQVPGVRLEQARHDLAAYVKELMDYAKRNAKPVPGMEVRVPGIVDAERVVKRALRLADMTVAEITKLSRSYAKRVNRGLKSEL